MGDRPTAVGVRGDVLAVHRRGRPGWRLGSAGIGPECRGGLFVVDGTVELTLEGVAHALDAGGYAYLPPDSTWTLHNREDRPASFHWIRKAYQRVVGLDAPEPVIAHEREIEPVAMPDTDGAWATTRFVDPADSAARHARHDRDPAPGASIPFAETHVMEHGLYVLQGKAVYLLNQDWVEVEAGDFMWLRAFCPQACCRGGAGALPVPALQGRQSPRSAQPPVRLMSGMIPQRRKRFPILLPDAGDEVYNQPGLAEGVCR